MMIRFKSLHPLLCFTILAIQPFTGLGEVKAPISTDTPIKLVQKKEKLDVNQRHASPASSQEEKSNISSLQDTTVAATATTTTTRTDTATNKSPKVHLRIYEPPQGSFIAGTNFFVGLQVLTSDSESEKLVYAARDEYKVCISIDEGHYSCWSTNSTIVYADAIHGSHSLMAKLYKDGNLLDDTASGLVTFTTVSDPTMNMTGIEFHSQQFSPPPQANTQHDDGLLDEEEIEDLDDDENENNSTKSDNDDLESDDEDSLEGVHVSFPSVELLTPSDQVSYTGSDLSIETLLNPQDPEQFSKYFQRSFTCFSIDMATAQPCFQLFKDTKPHMVGLNIGFHTIQASLTNPMTMELLDASRSGIQTFFMAGQDNQGAAFTAEINLRGKLHQIPIVKGGSLVAQTKALCRSVGLTEQAICLQTVYHHLHIVGRQVGFVLHQEGGF